MDYVHFRAAMNENCNEHSCINLSEEICFQFCWGNNNMLGHMVYLFNFSRNCQKVFQGVWTSPQQWMIFHLLHLLKILGIERLFNFNISDRWVMYFILVLFYSSQLINEVDHHFMSLFAICICTFVKCLFKSFDHLYCLLSYFEF